MSVTVQRVEYHQVHSYMTYDIEEQDIIEEFGSVYRFQDIGFSVDDEKYEADEEVTYEDTEKFTDFLAEYEYEREDDWFSDRNRSHDVEYRFPEVSE
tara:strand:+ start:6840 stop:7130 length:291 start_codon:yes stop_codon:yes gene_type:complete